MRAVVIDTNVLLVADGQHPDASMTCRNACIKKLDDIRKNSVIVLDDEYRILKEYCKKIDPERGKDAGAAFLKWLLNNLANSSRVNQVHVTCNTRMQFKEFPVAELELEFDASDRKFPAVANAHRSKPTILQAVDCKWLDWWKRLLTAGIRVEFICPDDACRFYEKKFSRKPMLPS